MRWLTLFLLAALVPTTLVGCGTSQPKEEPEREQKLVADETEVQPETSRAPPSKGPAESAPPDEPDTIRKVLSLIEASYSRRERQKPILRAAFAKGSGCAAGSLTVSKTIPLHLKWGIFSDAGKSYPLWARFSGANGGNTLPDTKSDGRGMAIKLLGVVGPKLLEDSEKRTQDLVFLSSPTFGAKDVADLMRKLSAAQRRPPYDVGSAFRGTQEPIANPLHEKYWSVFPSKLGDTAVKYQVVPTDCKSGKPLPRIGRPASDGAHGEFIRDAMKGTLGRGRACFSLEVQVWKDVVSTPIEDATVAWSTPFERVAWILLEREDAAKFDRNSTECEKMAFNPWHAITEQQPLGGLARLSREAYSLSARIRRQMNSWSDKEPPGP